MRKLKEFQRLLRMTEDLELSRLAVLMAKQKKLVVEIEQRRESRTRTQKETFATVESTSISTFGLSEKWGIWADNEIRERVDELMKLAAITEEQKRKVQITAGRVSAFEKIVRKKIVRK